MGCSCASVSRSGEKAVQWVGHLAHVSIYLHCLRAHGSRAFIVTSGCECREMVKIDHTYIDIPVYSLVVIVRRAFSTPCHIDAAVFVNNAQFQRWCVGAVRFERLFWEHCAAPARFERRDECRPPRRRALRTP